MLKTNPHGSVTNAVVSKRFQKPDTEGVPNTLVLIISREVSTLNEG